MIPIFRFADESRRLNPDLGEFVSTIYSRQFKPQKVQARQLALALGMLANEERELGGLPKELFDPVRRFLVALSHVMLKKDQDALIPPAVHLASNVPAGTSEIALTHRPVSLALVRLRSWSRQPQNIPYELHVHIEAAVAAALVLFLQACCPNDDIFVATPHRIQREAVKAALAKVMTNESMEETFRRMHIGDTKPKVTVDTIERLQGTVDLS